MKLSHLAVIIANKKGDCYQVILTDSQNDMVQSLIEQMHEGKIKVARKKLSSLSLIKQ